MSDWNTLSCPSYAQCVVAHTTTTTGAGHSISMKEPLRDAASGCEIPEDIQDLWKNTGPLLRMMSDLNNISVHLKAADDSRDPQYAEINMVDAIACVKHLKALITRAVPYAVCPACQGRLRDTCLLCKGRGAISKFLWESPAVTEGVRRITKAR